METGRLRQRAVARGDVGRVRQVRRVRLGPMRAEVLEHLRSCDGPASVGDVAKAVGLHPNTTRFHLDALVADGLVTRETGAHETPGRPKLLYRAARVTPDTAFHDLAQVMVHHFAGEIDDRSARAVEAGRAWGEQVRDELLRLNPTTSPLDRLMEGMAQLGYEPRWLSDPEPMLILKPCPYGQLASDDPDVICSLHLGLMRGILGPDQPWGMGRVEPFLTPDSCRVKLFEQRDGPLTASPDGTPDA